MGDAGPPYGMRSKAANFSDLEDDAPTVGHHEELLERARFAAAFIRDSEPITTWAPIAGTVDDLVNALTSADEGERCQSCGAMYHDAYWIENAEVWQAISPKPDKPGAGLLCPNCATNRLSAALTSVQTEAEPQLCDGCDKVTKIVAAPWGRTLVCKDCAEQEIEKTREALDEADRKVAARDERIEKLEAALRDGKEARFGDADLCPLCGMEQMPIPRVVRIDYGDYRIIDYVEEYGSEADAIAAAQDRTPGSEVATANEEAVVALTERLEAVEAERDAAKEAAQDLAERYGATVEWDSEGMPALTMPKPAATRREEALRKAIRDERAALEAALDAGEVPAKMSTSRVIGLLERFAALATTPEPPPAPVPTTSWPEERTALWEALGKIAPADAEALWNELHPEAPQHDFTPAAPPSSREDDAPAEDDPSDVADWESVGEAPNAK